MGILDGDEMEMGFAIELFFVRLRFWGFHDDDKKGLGKYLDTHLPTYPLLQKS